MSSQIIFQELIEQTNELKKKIYQQAKQMNKQINTLNCDPTVKHFLKDAVDVCFVQTNCLFGNIKVLSELLHSPKLNLQHLNIGSKIDIEKFLNCENTSLTINQGKNQRYLRVQSMVDDEYPTTLEINLDKNNCVTSFQTDVDTTIYMNS